jgi:YegS/Rv2252/BmrU family lipid kinase
MAGKRGILIFNPIAGRPASRLADAVAMQHALSARGIDIVPRPTRGPDDATLIAAEAVADGADLVVCYGGDGTINEVVQALARSQTSLAVWPGGTSNVIARELGMPFDLAGLANVIAEGRTMRVALGRASKGVELPDAEPSKIGAATDSSPVAGRETIESGSPPQFTKRFFLMMAGIGLDASIARSVNKRIKRRAGEVAYWLSGMRHLLSWQQQTFTIEAAGRRFESAFAVIGKGKGYGGRMVITPGASLMDSEFELFVLPPLPNNLAYVRVLLACLRGRPETTPATTLKADRVVANSNKASWVEVDGEVIGPLPMTFDVVPDALSLIVP